MGRRTCVAGMHNLEIGRLIGGWGVSLLVNRSIDWIADQR